LPAKAQQLACQPAVPNAEKIIRNLQCENVKLGMW